MAANLTPGRVWQGKRVTKVAPSKSSDDEHRQGLNVSVEGELKPRFYTHVISTVPLACLRMVDMEECKLSYALREALRGLHYKPSVKVGIRFQRRWWEEDLGHFGGVSKTDG
jgi:monoamine oxidase